jgi:transposase
MSPELSPSTRGQIVGMVKAGVSQRKVADELGISKGTVYNTMRRERLHNTQASLPKSGRPSKMDERDHRRLA